MNLRTEAAIGTWILLVIPIALSVVTVVLFERMTPAIERILDENVYSEEAVEKMLATLVLTEPRSAGEDALRAQFRDALVAARENITEPAEVEVVERIESTWVRAMDGDALARAHLVEALQRLGEINRSSMVRADIAAQQLGRAGAWASVFFGLAGLITGIAVYRRLRRRIELPIASIARTLDLARHGDTHARSAIPPAPSELRAMSVALNELLNRRADPSCPSPTDEDAWRVVRVLLDQIPTPAWIIEAETGRILAANLATLDADRRAENDPGSNATRDHVIEVPDSGLRVILAAPPPASAASP